MLIVNRDREIAEKEVLYLNNATKHLLKECELLVRLDCKEDESVFYYPLVNEYREFYTVEMLEKTIENI